MQQSAEIVALTYLLSEQIETLEEPGLVHGFTQSQGAGRFLCLGKDDVQKARQHFLSMQALALKTLLRTTFYLENQLVVVGMTL